MSTPRYAIYFVPPPETSLYRFGASVIGYDCYTRCEIAFPPEPPLTGAGWMKVTEPARIYGFHATVKAPFHLAEGADESGLERKLRAFAKRATATADLVVKLDLMKDFIAFVPQGPSPALGALAERCVVDLDEFRAPLTQDERHRRSEAGLSPRQAAHLERWGYPYVFEDFRFHMTLTGALGDSDRGIVFDYLQRLLDHADVAETVAVDRLCLLRQDWPGARFRMVSVAKLGGA